MICISAEWPPAFYIFHFKLNKELVQTLIIIDIILSNNVVQSKYAALFKMYIYDCKFFKDLNYLKSRINNLCIT